jgi:hypothetical protein
MQRRIVRQQIQQHHPSNAQPITRSAALPRTCGLQPRGARGRAFRIACVVASGLALLTAALRPARTQADPQVPPDFQKGFSFAAWWAGQYLDPGADLSLAGLQTTGANWVSLIVTAYQAHYDSTTIDYTSPHTPTDADLIHTIDLAHSMGLQVMLKPHLDLADEVESGLWRGDIGTGFSGEAQWEAWFDAYRTFIVHYAALAQAHGVEQFCIGTELLGTTPRADDWREIVAEVRAVFSGPIVYASLHSGEERSITWWDAVDYIGVDAYYPLNHDLECHPTTEELEPSWTEPKAVLASLHATYGKPILFTEIGYRSQHGCSVHPWDSWAESEIDDAEQANAYEAAFRQVYGEPWLGGIFWWSWYADRFKSGPCDDSYAPTGKTAEQIVRSWYGGAVPPPAPVLFPDYSQTLDVYGEGLENGWQNWSWNAQIDLSASDQARTGTTSLFATLSPWGAISLQHADLDVSPYAWLEFYVRAAPGSAPELQVFAHAADGTELAAVPVNDCRYIEEPLTADAWVRVRIPVRDLVVHSTPIARINIAEKNGDTTSFWVDDLRFVAGREPVAVRFLPLVDVTR